MPIYEYVCDACSHHIEVLQKFSDSPLSSCEKCGSVLRRLISKTSFQLKGGGWHATDYKSSSKSDTPKGGTPKSDTIGPEKNSTDKSSAHDSQSETKKEGVSEKKD